MVRSLTLLMLTLLLAACASSHVLTGTPRPPVDPAQVRVVFGPPPVAYEEIAQLQATSGGFTWGEQNKMNSVLRKLQREAAKLGANGVVILGIDEGYGGGGVGIGVGGGRHHVGGGIGVDISPRQKIAQAIAVHFNAPLPPSPPAPPAD
ncbi:hypothetical protein [Montanilutibacter psychrotolerans]|nr:hypothetical protein [Lysobacter psychrotolerans]